ncbi:cellulase family glycosylhydrolase [Streptomyces sp. NPDC096132]|uniref:cellulase family glycosylhydrolase n=1 Tax=Streptomyces sp. NPDC096132 TaxID=3366075 RepID=UPI0037F96FB3
MRRRTFLSLAVPAAVIPSSGNALSPTVAADSRPPAFGVQFHGLWDDYWARDGTPLPLFGHHLDRLRAHGVSLIRVDVGWSTSEPSRGEFSTSHYYNRRFATLLNAAARRSLKVLVTVHQSPQWARPHAAAREPFTQFPEDPESIRPWARWMAKTYGKHVYAWEVWNEPNLKAFTGDADPASRTRRYVHLLKACSAGLRSGDPSAVVVLGGPCYTDEDFIEGVYRGDARDDFDVLALHPYLDDQTKDPWDDEPPSRYRMTHFPAVLDVMRKYGDAAKPVWWTEFGFSVHSNAGVPAGQPWRRGVQDAATAGRSLVRSFELARLRYPQIRLGVVFTAHWARPATDTNLHQRGFGLMDAEGRARPQLTTLRDYFERHDGTRSLLAAK